MGAIAGDLNNDGLADVVVTEEAIKTTTWLYITDMSPF